MLYALNPDFNNIRLNLIISCNHLENSSGIGWCSASRNGEHILLGQFLYFVAAVTAEKERTDYPGANKKLWA